MTDVPCSRQIRPECLIVCAMAVLQLSACGLVIHPEEATRSVAATTYQKYLVRAEAGDAESQNLIGFMLFHGEGVAPDRIRAETWFRRAALQGNARAQRNLATMRSLGLSVREARPQRTPSAAPAQGPLSGEALYARFCAGCHGFNGIARYVHSPSFALGQALDRSDEHLIRSLLQGKGEMPNWDNKLSLAELRAILAFVRTLQSRYDAGIGQPLRDAPEIYFLFGPMSADDERIRDR